MSDILGHLTVMFEADTHKLNSAEGEIRKMAQVAQNAANKANAALSNTTNSAAELGNQVEESSQSWLTAGRMIGIWGGLAAGAMAITIKAMKSTGDTTDALQRELEGLRTSLDFVNISLATGDWQDFISNLVRSRDAAKDLYDTLDEVGNIRRSLAIQEAKNLTQLTQLAEIFRDRTGKYSVAQRQSAFMQWRGIRTEDTQKYAETATQLANAKVNNYAAQAGLSSGELRNIVENYSKYAVALERVRKELESVGGGNAQRAFVNFLSGSDKALGKLLLGFGKLTDEKLDDLTKAIQEEYAASARVYHVNLENIRTYNDIFKVVKDGAGQSTAEIGTLIKVMDQVAVSGKKAAEAFSTAPKTSLMQLGNTTPNMEGMENFIDQDKLRMQDELNQKLQYTNTLLSGSVDLFQAMGNAMNNSENAAQTLAQAVLTTGQRIISMLLEQAVANIFLADTEIAVKEAKKGLLGIATAAAGIALLTGIMSSAKSTSRNVARMKEGGVVPAGYPHDSYPALLTSGETVTPPKKLRDMDGRIEVVGEIRGRDMWLLNKKHSDYRNKVI